MNDQAPNVPSTPSSKLDLISLKINIFFLLPKVVQSAVCRHWSVKNIKNDTERFFVPFLLIFNTKIKNKTTRATSSRSLQWKKILPGWASVCLYLSTENGEEKLKKNCLFSFIHLATSFFIPIIQLRVVHPSVIIGWSTKNLGGCSLSTGCPLPKWLTHWIIWANLFWNIPWYDFKMMWVMVP